MAISEADLLISMGMRFDDRVTGKLQEFAPHARIVRIFLGELLEPVTELELYNLQSDIGERNNVAGQHPEVVERLAALADKARGELGDYNRMGNGVRFFEDGPKWPRRRQWMTQ